MIKIDKKIVGYEVNKSAAEEEAAKPEFKREGGGANRAEVAGRRAAQLRHDPGQARASRRKRWQSETARRDIPGRSGWPAG